MRRGILMAAAAATAIAGCGGEQGKLEVRALPTPLAAGPQPVPFRIAEARGHFALGNVALALEGYRKALREDPASIEAMAGVAACYDRMGRFDVSRRHYETALAAAPGDRGVLAAFAASLSLQGLASEARLVHQEIRDRGAAATAAASLPVANAAVVAEGRPAQLIPPRAAAVAAAPAQAGAIPPRAAVVAAPAPMPAGQDRVAAVPAHSPTRSAVKPQPPAPTTVAQAVRLTPAVPSAVGRSITIALPPARPVAPAPLATPARSEVTARTGATVVARAEIAPGPVRPASAPPAPTASPSALAAPAPPTAPQPRIDQAARPLPPKTPVDSAPRTAKADSRNGWISPRLERTSLREVALITASGPQWRPLTVARTGRSATVRFVPIRQASARVAGIRVLNAARVDKLAARTRLYLAGRGWRSISIGNAAAIRTRSVILYPAGRRRSAERLSAQFGFAIAQRPSARQLTILLGRDAARVSALRARG